MTIGRLENRIAGMFCFGHRTTIAPGTSSYLPGIGGTGQTAEITLVIQQDGRLRNLQWDCESNGLTGAGNTLRLRRAPRHTGPNTPAEPLQDALVIPIDGVTSGIDSVDIAVAGGDRIGILIDTVAGGTGIVRPRVSLLLMVQTPSQTWQLTQDTMATFFDTGHVGIGTATPAATLEVAGTLRVGPAGAPPGLEVDSAGNVGIGTTALPGKLNVAGQAFVQDQLTVSGAFGADLALQDTRPNGGRLDLSAGSNIGTVFVAGPNPLWIGNNNQAKIVIDGNGNVGVGAGPGIPQAPLHVRGQVLSSAGFCTGSSRRWKTNIRPLEGALDVVRRLQGVSFQWNEDGRRDIGLIAEDVAAVLPEVVTGEDDGDHARGLDYGRLTSLLIEAIKEQQREIEALRTAIADAGTPRPGALSTAGPGVGGACAEVVDAGRPTQVG
jgi:Chaperone of endosialidase